MTSKRSTKKTQDMESSKKKGDEDFLFKNVMQMMILQHQHDMEQRCHEAKEADNFSSI